MKWIKVEAGEYITYDRKYKIKKESISKLGSVQMYY